ncbi:Crp/Fnr family transcriptional regulator [Flavivirga eckloniae]|uniref:Crp/Fnr family transcriptional regulator n=1 Tax=Flavivirga eckloniae TaxID=1803846 RepID=A0A2K9PXK6_9FLAO|nr:Crp/Fnr family transcriptional regulator [Flavivirga eckloniae]AUP81277.1 Crp/Fnr family transcriptional regulator [Flavivirga eckloniae]
MNYIEEKYIELYSDYINSFSPVSQESLEQLLSLMKIRDVDKGETLVFKGQVARNILFVCEGILISQWMDDKANVYVKNFFLKGFYAGSTVSMLKSLPSHFGVECIEAGKIIEMDYHKYKEVIFKNEDLKSYYIKHIEQNWIVENEKRQISFAAQDAKERYFTFLDEYPDLPDRVPQWQIASYLGITPTQLSRIRRDL